MPLPHTADWLARQCGKLHPIGIHFKHAQGLSLPKAFTEGDPTSRLRGADFARAAQLRLGRLIDDVVRFLCHPCRFQAYRVPPAANRRCARERQTTSANAELPSRQVRITRISNLLSKIISTRSVQVTAGSLAGKVSKFVGLNPYEPALHWSCSLEHDDFWVGVEPVWEFSSGLPATGQPTRMVSSSTPVAPASPLTSPLPANLTICLSRLSEGTFIHRTNRPQMPWLRHS